MADKVQSQWGTGATMGHAIEIPVSCLFSFHTLTWEGEVIEAVAVQSLSKLYDMNGITLTPGQRGNMVFFYIWGNGPCSQDINNVYGMSIVCTFNFLSEKVISGKFDSIFKNLLEVYKYVVARKVALY